MNLRERGCEVSRRDGVKGNCSGMYCIRKKLFSIKKIQEKGKGKMQTSLDTTSLIT